MIDKLYYYFLKTKYSDYSEQDVVKLKEIYNQCRTKKLSINLISKIKRQSIELGVMGKELTPEARKVDNFILNKPFVVESFIEDEIGYKAQMRKLT